MYHGRLLEAAESKLKKKANANAMLKAAWDLDSDFAKCKQVRIFVGPPL